MADLSSVVPVSMSLFTPMPMLALYTFRCIYTCKHTHETTAEEAGVGRRDDERLEGGGLEGNGKALLADGAAADKAAMDLEEEGRCRLLAGGGLHYANGVHQTKVMADNEHQPQGHDVSV